MRLCVTTYFDDGFAPIGKICAATLKLYAQRHGFDLHVEREISSERPPAGNKILLLQQLLRQNYDFVLWIDADALFMRFSPDIRSEIVDGKDLFLVNHEVRRPIQPGASLCLDIPNTGVMLLRNSDWTLSFLDAIWRQTQLIDHQFWENAAVHALMGYHFLVDSAQRNQPDDGIMTKIGFIDRAWNSVPGKCESENPIVHHYAGHNDRLTSMQKDLKISENAWKLGH